MLLACHISHLTPCLEVALLGRLYYMGQAALKLARARSVDDAAMPIAATPEMPCHPTRTSGPPRCFSQPPFWFSPHRFASPTT